MSTCENIYRCNNNGNNNSVKDISPSAHSTWKVLLTIFISLLLDLTSFTIILPLLPSIITHYSKNDSDYLYNAINDVSTLFKSSIGLSHTSQWNSVLFGGFIGSLFSFLQFVSSPVIGSLSDIYGRRPIMLVSLIGMSMSYILWFYSNSFTIFILSRVVGGISKGNVNVAIAIVADQLPISKRGKGMAMIGVAYSIGFIVGPMIGAYFSYTRDADDVTNAFYTIPAAITVVMSLINILFNLIFLPETLQTNNQNSEVNVIKSAVEHLQPGSLLKFSTIKDIGAQDKKEMSTIAFVYFMYLFLFSGAEFTLSFLTHERFHYESMQQGKMFFFIGSIMIIIQGGYVRRLKFGQEKTLILKGLLALILSLIIIAFVINSISFYFALALFSSAAATVVPCLNSLISLYGAPDQKGSILGIFRSVGSCARAFGPFVCCSVYWCFGPTACYVLCGIGLLLPLMCLNNLKFEKNSN